MDAINEGAGPIGEAILGAAAGGAVGVLKGAAEGIAKGVLTDVAGAQANPLSRAAQLGVETTTEGLAGAMTPLDLAVERGASTFNQVAGGKVVRATAVGEFVREQLNDDLTGYNKSDVAKDTNAPRRPSGPEDIVEGSGNSPDSVHKTIPTIKRAE